MDTLMYADLYAGLKVWNAFTSETAEIESRSDFRVRLRLLDGADSGILLDHSVREVLAHWSKVGA